LPLILLAFPGITVTSVMALAMVGGVLIFGSGSVIQFTTDLVPKPFDWALYTRQRWLIPIARELHRQEPTVENGGIVGTSQIYQILASPERNRLNGQIVTGLSKYLEDANTYNDAVHHYTIITVKMFNEDRTLGPLTKGYNSPKGGRTLHPGEFLIDDQPFDKLLEGLEASTRNSENDISIETDGPGWSHVELKIPGKDFYRDAANAAAVLTSIRSRLLPTEEAKELVRARKKRRESSARLTQLIPDDDNHK
jgi:hypothetical protein